MSLRLRRGLPCRKLPSLRSLGPDIEEFEPQAARLAIDLCLDRCPARDKRGIADQKHPAVRKARALVLGLARSHRFEPARLGIGDGGGVGYREAGRVQASARSSSPLRSSPQSACLPGREFPFRCSFYLPWDVTVSKQEITTREMALGGKWCGAGIPSCPCPSWVKLGIAPDRPNVSFGQLRTYRRKCLRRWCHFLPSDPLSLCRDTAVTQAGYSVNLDGRMELDVVEANYQQLSNKLEQQPYNNWTDVSVGSILRLWDQPC